MADTVVLREFLAVLGYRIDEQAQRKFSDAILSMTNVVLGLGAGMTATLATVTAAITAMAQSGEQMNYLSQRIGDTVKDIDAITFAFSKMGLAPQAAIASMRALADEMRNNPGLRSLFQHYTGSTEVNSASLQSLMQRYASAAPEIQRVIRAQFAALPMDFWLAAQRPGFAQGVAEANSVMRMFRFDPDQYAKDATALENAWRSLGLRMDTIWSHIAGRLQTNITQAYTDFTNFLDKHSSEIIQFADLVLDEFGRVTLGLTHLFTDIYKWFDGLGAKKEIVVEAIAAIGLAFLGAGWLKIAAIAFVLEKLITDYEKFKETGKSPLGIPWEAIGQGIDKLVTKMKEVSDATNGWISPLTAIEVLIGVKIVRAVWSMAAAFGAASTAAATSLTTGVGAALQTVLTTATGLFTLLSPVLGVALGLRIGKNDIATGAQEKEVMRNEKFPTPPPGGYPMHQTTPEEAARMQREREQHDKDENSPGIFGKLFGLLSYLNPISVAKGAELPDHVQTLSKNVVDLNETLNEILDNSLYGNGAGGGGAGSYNPNNPFGIGLNGAISPPSSEPSGDAQQRALTLMQRLQHDLGATSEGAAADASNAYAESGIQSIPQHGVPFTNASGFGIYQYTGHRRVMRDAFAAAHPGMASAEIDYQYHLWELTHLPEYRKYLEVLRKHGDPTELANEFFGYESGNDPRLEPVRGGHIANANRMYKILTSAGTAGNSLMRSPNISHTSTVGPRVDQTNNVTIHTSSDPNDIMRAWDHQNQRHVADIQRNLNVPLR